MPSGKRSRELRRAQAAPPPVGSKGAARGRRASPRVLLGAGVAVLVLVIGVVLAVVVFGGGSSSSAENSPAVGATADGLPSAAEVNTLYRGIPQQGTTLGAASAPVTLVEFVDLQCPYCQQFETQVFPDIVRSYVRTGKLKVVLQPLAFIGSDSVRGQAAVLAAAKQNRAFNYTALLYDNQGPENTGWLSDDLVTATAASIPGLAVQKLRTERNSASVKAQAQDVADAAKTANVTGTPTLLVGETGTAGTQVMLKAPSDKATLVQAIEAAGGS